MATGKLLRQLIKSGVEGNRDAFRTVSEQVIQEERQKQHHLLANDLERLLYGRPRELDRSTAMPLDKAPVDRERNLALLELREPVRRLDDVVLSDETRSALEEVLEEHHHTERLASYGMRAADRLLFYGPPGCGKTLTAEVIASELGLPLAIVRIDTVVSSYLGETAANLRKVFDFAVANAAVVVLDEFDALAKERADESEHGELRRVVNAVLQMMDAYAGRSVLIAATNHETILDLAVWRRFEEVLVFEPPNLEQLCRLLTMKLRGVRREFDVEQSEITALFKDMTHADVERVLRRAIKEMVLAGHEFLCVRHLDSAARRERPRQARQRGS
ncbi:MAG: AAA family ATPase [Candidatus Handelsmanbacteria bacterium RIFCSPLOWO2_12_FULL_64_10]|uniref:AAA family ATPase n=1 Tax=Handelsmanbacteria sp. (strain RIFCSPLOWO2_12_FULL_64_10) TaxID=1817868 RepID=A0A1F6C894_HANXR|nr:MAG: AAA family ATPase [Candidatus Handelsmanbacteria bacterium RIFCSPLOWO2_12_FULL_64_10]